MAAPRILVLGASYGSLLATKLLLAGHDVTLVGRHAEADLIAREGTRVRMPTRDGARRVEVDSNDLPGRLAAVEPHEADPEAADLVVLAMQEPQYGAPEVRDLLAAVGASRRPVMSVMNMPPPPFVARLAGVDLGGLEDCYADMDAWASLDPARVTLCSPDPQAVRPPTGPDNVLEVRLPTNFKAAPFDDPADTALLRRLAADVDAARHRLPDGPVQLPVRLRVHDSLFVPLAKWSMLLAGNYRCVQADGVRSIRDAVHGDIRESRAMYEWVGDVCRALGASDGDLVPFERYASAAAGLDRPSSAARAIAAGAARIERVDRLVQAVAGQRGMRSPQLDAIVALVDARLAANRAREPHASQPGVVGGAGASVG